MPDDQQYTDAQLSDGRTLRFQGQLGPDEIKQKVSAFRTREGAKNIQANPPGVQRPSLKMQMSNWGTRPDKIDNYSGPGAWPNPYATTAAGNSTAYKAAVGVPVAGAAAVMGGPLLAPVVAAHPKISTMAAIEASHYLPGTLGRLARQIPTWAGAMAGGGGGGAATEEGEAAGSTPSLADQVRAQPSGRLVLDPAEAQAETQQMSLAKKMAQQRGMQYAAGQKPQN